MKTIRDIIGCLLLLVLSVLCGCNSAAADTRTNSGGHGAVAVHALQSANGSTNFPTLSIPLMTFSVIPEMTCTLSGAARVKVEFTSTFTLISGDSFEFAIFMDGSEVAGTRRHERFTGASGLLGLLPGSLDGTSGTSSAIMPVTTASHTYDIRWQVLNQTARAYSTQRRIDCLEVD